MIRRFHRLIGIVLLIPMLSWAVTAAVFFIKPGYAAAYEVPQIKTYPLGSVAAIPADPSWIEIRRLRTVLGEHLLVRGEQGWQQLDPVTLQPAAMASTDRLETLIADALPASARYGHILMVEGATATTDTGVRVTLDWDRLTLSQRGRDTDWIDRLYKFHYLQWTGVGAIDRVLGAAGILLLIGLSLLGARLALKRV